MNKETEHKRRISKIIKEDLSKKMVLLAGPRQCGKTTLAKNLLEKITGEYYNWDRNSHRKSILKDDLNHQVKLWVFDEIHKYKSWRNWLKGNFDVYGKEKQILVTGSAKLDLYHRAGDSLQGRYYLHRLHPFTLGELSKSANPELESIPLIENSAKPSDNKFLLDLLRLGGFPEPLFSSSEKEARRWRNSYGSRLIREDIRDLEQINNIDKMELLYEHLPETIGSTLSINSLREDLEVNHQTVKRWLEIFEKNYICFRIPPLTGNLIKAVKKEQKLYFWDWSINQNNEAKAFENLIALHLLRLCHWCLDVLGEKLELRYFRDTVHHEVDFILLKDKKPWIAIEAKLSESELDPNLKYLLERTHIPYAFQLHLHGNSYRRVGEINQSKITIMPAADFLINLP